MLYYKRRFFEVKDGKIQEKFTASNPALKANESVYGEDTVYSEAGSFQISSGRNVLQKLISLLQKKIGQKFFGSIPLDIKIGPKQYTSFVFLIGDGNKAIRVNLRSGESSFKIESIDFYNKVDKNPHLTLKTHGLNVIQLVDIIVNTIKTGKASKNQIFEEDIQLESKFIYSEAERGASKEHDMKIMAWLRDKKLKVDYLAENRIVDLYNQYVAHEMQLKIQPIEKSQFYYRVGKILQKNNLTNIYSRSANVTTASKTHVVYQINKKEEQRVEKEIAKRLTPKEKFSQLEAAVQLVVNGQKPGLVVTGPGGTGKTFTVKKILKKSGADFKSYKGTIASAINLYELLYENNIENFIILLDDNDTILDDKEALNILKGALEASESERTISYRSNSPILRRKDIPNEFDFVGKIIFISNKSMHQIPQTLRSRSFKVNVDLTPEEILKRIEEIIDSVEEIKKAPAKAKKDALKFMKEHIDDFEQFDIRSFFDVVHWASTENKNWQKWAYASLRDAFN